MHFEWPYYTLRAGKLYADGEAQPLAPAPLFKDSAEAEQWLIDNDIRGSVR